MKSYRKIFFLFVMVLTGMISLAGSSVNAQTITWQKVLNYTVNSVLYKTQQTSDGGFIAVGESRIGIYQKVFLVKFNKIGDTLWTKYYDLNLNSDYRGKWVEETYDKGFIIAGNGNNGGMLIKTDSNGINKWIKNYGGVFDRNECVKQTDDQGFILVLSTSSFGPTTDIMLIKTDSLGNKIWNKVYIQNNSNESPRDLKILHNGYILTGTKWILGDSATVYLMRTDNMGDTLWTKTYGGQRSSGGYSIENTDEKGFIVCGSSNSFNSDHYTQSYIAKIDSIGNMVWERCYSSNYYEEGHSIIKTNYNNYVFCGTSDSIKRYYERAFIRKIDLNGNVLLEKFYRGGDESNQFTSIGLTSDNGFILGGYATFNTGAINSYMVKTDSLGDVSTKIKLIQSLIINNYVLFQNYPNPFNPSTTISFSIPIKGNVKLSVYDISGREIRVLLNEKKNAGSYSFNFDGRNLSSGVYFYILSSEDHVETRKMILMK